MTKLSETFICFPEKEIISKAVENGEKGVHEIFFLFYNIFHFSAHKSHFLSNIKISFLFNLQMFSIWLNLKYCCLIKD